MKRKSGVGLVMAAAVLCLAAGLASAAITTNTWTGAGNDGSWGNALNWDIGMPVNKNTNTVVFDNGSATGRTITYGTATDSTRPTQMYFMFTNAAKSYFFADDHFDNSGGGELTTAASVTNDQVITGWRFGTSTLNFTLNGSGDVTVSNLFHQIAWDVPNRIALNFAVANNAVLTVGGIKALAIAPGYGRRLFVTKSGLGKLVLGGTIEYPYGTNAAGGFTSTVVRVTAGEVDLSAATLKLTNSLSGSGYAIPTNVVYMLVDYTNATLVGNSSFGSVTNLPAGFEIFNDTKNCRIVLRQEVVAQRLNGCIVVVR